MLRAFIDDEPPIRMQIDGMTAFPFGDPANYLKAGAAVPAYWLNLRYPNLP
jgi:hypothetical protein